MKPVPQDLLDQQDLLVKPDRLDPLESLALWAPRVRPDPQEVARQDRQDRQVPEGQPGRPEPQDPQDPWVRLEPMDRL